MIPALLGAFATLISGGLGAAASSRAAQENYNINLLNYNQRERERFDAINQAKHQEADTKLGQTDANGNRIHFVEGKGWVTDLSPEQQALQQLYQREELGQLQNDLPKKRDILNSNVVRQGRENTQADALLNAFQRVQRENPRETENLLNQASSAGITQGFDSTLQDAMQSAIRTGASNSGKVAAAIGAERAKALQQAFMENHINAKGQSQSDFENKRGGIANLYNMFATRASAMPDVSFNPQNINGQTAQQSGQSQSAQQNAAGALINAFAKQGGVMATHDPDYGLANAVAQGGNALYSAFDLAAADRQRQKALNSYGNYAGVDPSMYKTGTGDW